MTNFQGTPLEGYTIKEIREILDRSKSPFEITDEKINALGSDPTLPIIFQFQENAIKSYVEDGVKIDWGISHHARNLIKDWIKENPLHEEDLPKIYDFYLLRGLGENISIFLLKTVKNIFSTSYLDEHKTERYLLLKNLVKKGKINFATDEVSEEEDFLNEIEAAKFHNEEGLLDFIRENKIPLRAIEEWIEEIEAAKKGNKIKNSKTEYFNEFFKVFSQNQEKRHIFIQFYFLSEEEAGQKLLNGSISTHLTPLQNALDSFQRTAQEFSSLQEIFPALSESDLETKGKIREVEDKIDRIDNSELVPYKNNRKRIKRLGDVLKIRNDSSHDKLTSLNELTPWQKEAMWEKAILVREETEAEGFVSVIDELEKESFEQIRRKIKELEEWVKDNEDREREIKEERRRLEEKLKTLSSSLEKEVLPELREIKTLVNSVLQKLYIEAKNSVEHSQILSDWIRGRELRLEKRKFGLNEMKFLSWETFLEAEELEVLLTEFKEKTAANQEVNGWGAEAKGKIETILAEIPDLNLNCDELAKGDETAFALFSELLAKIYLWKVWKSEDFNFKKFNDLYENLPNGLSDELVETVIRTSPRLAGEEISEELLKNKIEEKKNASSGAKIVPLNFPHWPEEEFFRRGEKLSTPKDHSSLPIIPFILEQELELTINIESNIAINGKKATYDIEPLKFWKASAGVKEFKIVTQLEIEMSEGEVGFDYPTFFKGLVNSQQRINKVLNNDEERDSANIKIVPGFKKATLKIFDLAEQEITQIKKNEPVEKLPASLASKIATYNANVYKPFLILYGLDLESVNGSREVYAVRGDAQVAINSFFDSSEKGKETAQSPVNQIYFLGGGQPKATGKRTAFLGDKKGSPAMLHHPKTFGRAETLVLLEKTKLVEALRGNELGLEEDLLFLNNRLTFSKKEIDSDEKKVNKFKKNFKEAFSDLETDDNDFNDYKNFVENIENDFGEKVIFYVSEIVEEKNKELARENMNLIERWKEARRTNKNVQHPLIYRELEDILSHDGSLNDEEAETQLAKQNETIQNENERKKLQNKIILNTYPAEPEKKLVEVPIDTVTRRTEAGQPVINDYDKNARTYQLLMANPLSIKIDKLEEIERRAELYFGNYVIKPLILSNPKEGEPDTRITRLRILFRVLHNSLEGKSEEQKKLLLQAEIPGFIGEGNDFDKLNPEKNKLITTREQEIKIDLDLNNNLQKYSDGEGEYRKWTGWAIESDGGTNTLEVWDNYTLIIDEDREFKFNRNNLGGLLNEARLLKFGARFEIKTFDEMVKEDIFTHSEFTKLTPAEQDKIRADLEAARKELIAEKHKKDFRSFTREKKNVWTAYYDQLKADSKTKWVAEVEETVKKLKELSENKYSPTDLTNLRRRTKTIPAAETVPEREEIIWKADFNFTKTDGATVTLDAFLWSKPAAIAYAEHLEAEVSFLKEWAGELNDEEFKNFDPEWKELIIKATGITLLLNS